jgi:hypothetical protein
MITLLDSLDDYMTLTLKEGYIRNWITILTKFKIYII